MAENKELDERIITLSEEGNDNKAIVAKLKEEDVDVSAQKVGVVISKYKKSLVEVEEQLNLPEINDNGCYTFKAGEYEAYSKANGRSAFGGRLGKKVKATKEELRALINSHWTPSRVMEKFQLEEEDLIDLVRILSHAELRDKLIVCNFKLDFFR